MRRVRGRGEETDGCKGRAIGQREKPEQREMRGKGENGELRKVGEREREMKIRGGETKTTSQKDPEKRRQREINRGRERHRKIQRDPPHST